MLTWRAAFRSLFAFVAAYFGDCDSVSPLQPNSTFAQCVPGVFTSRLVYLRESKYNIVPFFETPPPNFPLFPRALTASNASTRLTDPSHSH